MKERDCTNKQRKKTNAETKWKDNARKTTKINEDINKRRKNNKNTKHTQKYSKHRKTNIHTYINTEQRKD